MNRPKSYRRSIASVALILTVLGTGVALAADETPAGSIRYITETAQVTRGSSAPAELKAGDRIFEKDVLTTSKAGSLSVIMRDNTTLSLGSNSKITIQKFMFAPEKGQLASVMRISKGTVACATGEIAKLSPNAVKFESPISSIGIRGTQILINVEDGQEEAGEK